MTTLPAVRKPKRHKISNEELYHHIKQLEFMVVQLRSDLITTFHDDCCRKRQSISKILGDRLIEKLEGEDKARRHTLEEF